MNRLLPQPLFSVFLWLVWLLLVNSVAPGQMVLGAVLAVGLPLVTSRFWPERPRLRRPGLMLRYLVVLLWDIVAANFAVARRILAPTHRLHPAFVRFPVDLQNDFAIAVLASTISLTPGTVSADLSTDRRTLLIHVLDVEDEAALIAAIKQRYEAPLQEIFAC